jgi:hypothetical protein
MIYDFRVSVADSATPSPPKICNRKSPAEVCGLQRLAQERPWLTSLLLLAIAVLVVAAGWLVVAIAQDDPQALLESGELRNRLLGIYTGLTARPTQTADLAPIAHTDGPPVGVNTFLEQEVEEAKLRRTLALVRDAGIGWIRQEFPWDDIEIHGKGDFQDRRTSPSKSAWDKYDRIVNLTNEYGLRLVARLDTVPAWARPPGSTFTYPPTNLDDYGDFVAAVVGRYRSKIRYYQIWNEPNLAFEWGEQNINAAAYARLLQVAYTRAKSADPDCVIIAGALAPTIDPGPRNRSDVLFLEEMYRDGAAGYFDVLSTMAYGLRSGPDDRRIADQDVNFSRPILLREIMVRHGDAAKPIWLSEMGWNALPSDFPETPRYGRVSEAQQARYTVRGLQCIQAEWPWVGVTFLWYLRQPGNWQASQQEYYFRLVDPDFTPRPVYQAVQAYATRPPLLSPGYHPASHWAIQTQGAWQNLPDAQADPSRLSGQSFGTYRLGEVGATLSFAFQGSDLDLVARSDGRPGVLQVAIDGSAAGVSLPRDAAGRAVLDLASASSAAARFPIARGLPDGEHNVTITVADGAVAISGFIVQRTPGFPAGLLWAGVGVALVWAFLWRLLAK